MHRRLLGASRGGTLPLTVDLTDVTVLASAGVAVLREVRLQLAAHHQWLDLRAPDSSPSASVLDVVPLAYRTAGAR